MSNDSRDWKWVDVDPFEKQLLVEKALREFTPPIQHQPEPDITPLAYASVPAQAAEDRREENIAPGTHIEMARSLEKLGQWEAASDAFRWALETLPDCGEARLGLGTCLLHLDRAQE